MNDIAREHILGSTLDGYHRLHGVHNGEVIASCDDRLIAGTSSKLHECRGRLPPGELAGGFVDATLRTTAGAYLAEQVIGRFPRVTIHPVDPDRLIATTSTILLTSRDGGETWTTRYRLPDSSPPFGVLPSAICNADGVLYVGEYPQRMDVTPHVLRSTDGGCTWEPMMAFGDVRHIHSIQRDPYSGDLWITTGDADSECQIVRLRDGTRTVLGSGNQEWRAVELAFTPHAILWGVDCPYTSRRAIYRVDRHDTELEQPTRVGTVDGSVFYSAVTERDGDTWVAFSTAVEPSLDSTAPEARVYPASGAAVFVASSATEFTEWFEMLRFRKRRVLADVTPFALFPNANAYVFLAAVDGVFLANPFNTARADGCILRFSPKSEQSSPIAVDSPMAATYSR